MLAALNLAAFVLAVATYFTSGLQRAPLSYRYYSSTLATAITALREIANDGTASSELTKYFQSHGPALADDELKASLTIPISRPYDRIVVFQSDDLGLPRFAEASFLLFGVSLGALHKLFFLLLGVGTLAFVVTYLSEPVALFLSLCILLAVYAVEFVLPVSSQLLTAIDARFIGVLGIVPCLHLCLAVATKRWSAHAVQAAVVQSVLIAAVYQIRSSSGWSLLCVAGVACGNAGSMIARTRSWRSGIPSLVPVLIAVTCLVSVTALQRAHLAKRFRSSLPSGHVFWHGTHVGLGTHPELARAYGLSSDDLPAFRHVFQYFTDIGDEQTLRAVFGGDGRTFDSSKINWRPYDKAARTVVMHVIHEHPWQAVEVFVYYKPLMFARTVMWAIGKQIGPVEAIGMSQTWLMPEADRRRTDAYLRLFRPVSLFLCVAAIACIATSSHVAPAAISLTRGAGTMVVIFLASLTPGLLVYPAFHWIADAIVAGCALVYVVITFIIDASRRSLVGH